MKDTDSRQNVACALREHRWGKIQGGRHSLRLEAARKKKRRISRALGAQRSPGGQGGLSWDVVVNDREFLKQSEFHSLSLHLGSQRV